MAKFVMIPLDGSTLAEQALPLGVSLAQEIASTGADSVLQLVQVVPTPDPFMPISTPDGLITQVDVIETFRATGQDYLDNMKEQLTEAGITVKTHLLEGDAAKELAMLANREEVAYMVISTHGRGGLSRWTLGSVADKVLHLIERPLIIMRPQETMLNMSPFRFSPVRRIVVPLDGSTHAMQVLSHAKKVARLYDAELLLFRSVSAVTPGMSGPEMAFVDTRLYELNLKRAEDDLKEIQASLKGEGFKVRVAVGGMPITDAILAYAAQSESDLIAMATHARGPIGRMIMGSVTDGVVRAGQVPVLVVRTETKE